MQQLRAHVAVCRGWDLRPQLKMGEREVANIQVIITPTGVDRDTALSLDGTEMVRPENTIQIVPTANRMVIAKLLEKLQLHLPSFTSFWKNSNFIYLHLQRRAEDPTEAVSRGWNRRPY